MNSLKIDNGMISQLSFNDISIEFTDDILVYTDKGVYIFSDMECVFENGIYVFKGDNAEFTVKYANVESASFITRSITAKFDVDTVLTKISAKLPDAEEQFLYETFYNASAAVFSRNGDIGFCCGFENPYCKLENNFLFFEPSLLLKKNEIFECDLNFYGVYEIYGEKIQPELNKTQIHVNGRYHPRYRNPGEGTPLYFSEINEFGKYTSNYFGCDEKEFKFMTYDFFGNLPQRPQNEKEYQAYIEHIDAVAAIGCDTILLNPLFPNKIPDEDENSFWELFPENTYAEKILMHTRNIGLKIGMYTGTAGNGKYGNSSMIGYADNNQWKKTDVLGNIGEENCIADDNFVEWYIKVQINTIKKYNLDVWAWDPGPGNAFFCHSKNHGHLPGKGAYKGFRNTLKIMKALKEAVPGLYYQGFHGNKEYGLWGFKYIDQHEAFWENEVYVMNPVFDDLSVDRVTADNIRQQSVWNYYFRFMPATLNHGIANRMIQANWMGLVDLDYVFDYTGWKYALLSSVAYGGPITNTIVPRNPEKIKGYIEFYNEWIEFAKENFKYSKCTIPFGSQVGCGIDAVSKIIDNNGYIFLFNPFPENIEFEFRFNRRIGFINDGSIFYVDMIYPHKNKIDSVNYGDSLKVVVPAYECIVMKASTGAGRAEADVVTMELPRVLHKNDDGKYTFFAYREIESLLHKYIITGKEISVQKDYAEKFNRINSCWSRPDRLWLFVRAENPLQSAYLVVNGDKVKWAQDYLAHNELCVKGMVFADITDGIIWESDNKIELSGFGETAVYIHYQKPQNEQLPQVGDKYEMKNSCTPQLTDKVQVLSARINDNNIIVPDAENELCVKVNVPFEDLEGVYASVPISIGDTGYDLKRDMALEYKNGVWTKSFKSGQRINLIVDDFKISIWAVTKDKRESKTYYLPIEWLLK